MFGALIFLYAHPGKTQAYKPLMGQHFLGMFRLSKSSLSQMFLLTSHRRNTKYAAKQSDTVRKEVMYIMRKVFLTFDAYACTTKLYSLKSKTQNFD